jgi:hypothetical protein
MESKEKKTVIDGVTFQVAPFMAIEGLRLKAHLIRIFGPALGELLGGIDGKNVKNISEINLGSNSLSSGLEKLFQQLDEDSFIALIKRLFSNVIAIWNESGKSRSIAFGNDFETAMQLVFLGKLFSIYELIIFVLKVNYPDFFDKVVKGIGERIQKTLTSEKQEVTPPSESEQSEISES